MRKLFIPCLTILTCFGLAFGCAKTPNCVHDFENGHCLKCGLTEDKAILDDILNCKHRLESDKNGNFRVLILADVHANSFITDAEAIECSTNIKKLVDEESPDLVIFTGDNAVAPNPKDLRRVLDILVGYIEECKIPWCHVYGNHDNDYDMTKEDMQAVYESYKWCVSKSGMPNVSGVGNYALPVYKHGSNKIDSIIWCMDSNRYISEEDLARYPSDYEGKPDSVYDFIKKDQIDWYCRASDLLERHFGKKVPGLMAFHIPLQETYFAWQNRESLGNYDGDIREPICASRVNSGMFDAMVSKGNILAVVNGHDHLNDLAIDYFGIKLCYSPTMSKLGYFDENLLGSRVFVMNGSQSKIDTYVNFLNDDE